MIARTVGLVVAYGALTGLLTWPLPLQIGSHVLASGPFFLGDILLIVWATTWRACARHGPVPSLRGQHVLPERGGRARLRPLPRHVARLRTRVGGDGQSDRRPERPPLGERVRAG